MSHPTLDQTQPTSKWQFDGTVTECFDNMLQRSIPQYEIMRKACCDLALAFVRDGTAVVDLGCSRGEALAPLVDVRGVHNRFVGVEVSEPMIQAARKRFEGYIGCGVMDIRRMDLRTAYPPEKASVTLAVLSLQFIPIEYRQTILRSIYRHTIPGGALILVEKVLGDTAEIDKVMVDLYYRLKRDNGYSQGTIDRKRLSLEGVLVPVTARMNEQFMRSAGFEQIDCFWRWMNFAGWLAVKEGSSV